MPKLTVISSEAPIEMRFSCGSSVREVLDASGVQIRSGCRGNGACGLCLVQVEAGNTNEPSKNERLLLSPDQLDRNVRLACQLVPEDDLSIRIINSVSKSGWRDLTEGYAAAPLSDTTATHSIETKKNGNSGLSAQNLRPVSHRQTHETEYGLAIDLGTTHISVSLCDVNRGIRISGRIGLNPQSCYGADVVTRLIAADESPDNARKIGRMPLDAIHEALIDMRLREGISRIDISRVVIVGNTPMLSLLTGTEPGILLQPRYWTQHIECRLHDPETCARIMGISPQATMQVVPPLAGFVGSDLLAGVLATGLTEHPGGLLIDFGTNSEIALWDGSTLWVTSAAGGPAFEGCGMQCGVPAESGAIFRVDRHDAAGLNFHVIGGGEATGFCGSGLVDLIALLRDSGELTLTGRFSMPDHKDGFSIHRNGSTIRLTKGDVDMFQRAKAAIGVGIRTLLTKARMSAKELSRICVCGAFGRHLNARNARLIGLLPDIPPERIELCGNTALAGCEHLLLSRAAGGDLTALRKCAAIINLSGVTDFEALYLDNLYLKPLSEDEN